MDLWVMMPGYSFNLFQTISFLNSLLQFHHFSSFPFLQRANLSAHLEKVRSDVENVISDPGFSGLLVVDYEKWRPLYEQNWSSKRIYRYESLLHVEQRFPNATNTEKLALAIKEFNNASM